MEAGKTSILGPKCIVFKSGGGLARWSIRLLVLISVFQPLTAAVFWLVDATGPSKDGEPLTRYELLSLPSGDLAGR